MELIVCNFWKCTCFTIQQMIFEIYNWKCLYRIASKIVELVHVTIKLKSSIYFYSNVTINDKVLRTSHYKYISSQAKTL